MSPNVTEPVSMPDPRDTSHVRTAARTNAANGGSAEPWATSTKPADTASDKIAASMAVRNAGLR